MTCAAAAAAVAADGQSVQAAVAAASVEHRYTSCSLSSLCNRIALWQQK